MTNVLASLFGQTDAPAYVPTVRLPQAEVVKVAESGVQMADVAKTLADVAGRLSDPTASREIMQQAKRILDLAQQNVRAAGSAIRPPPLPLAPDV